MRRGGGGGGGGEGGEGSFHWTCRIQGVGAA